MESAEEATKALLQTQPEPELESAADEREHYPGLRYSALAVVNGAVQQVRGTRQCSVCVTVRPFTATCYARLADGQVTVCCTASGLGLIEIAYVSTCRSTQKIYTNDKQARIQQSNQAKAITC